MVAARHNRYMLLKVGMRGAAYMGKLLRGRRKNDGGEDSATMAHPTVEG